MPESQGLANLTSIDGHCLEKTVCFAILFITTITCESYIVNGIPQIFPY